MRVAVIGHVEWVDFVSLERFPEEGEVAHATEAFSRAAGGGSVVAAVLAELGSEVDFYTALGRDPHGEAAAAELQDRGINLHVAWRDAPTRRAITLLRGGGERTIVTIGERLAPAGDDDLDWSRLRQAAGAYFTAGDAGALALARTARVLTASPRARDVLDEEGERPILDAIIFSAHDHDESAWAARTAHRTKLLVATEGAEGGRWWGAAEGRWRPQPPPGEARDAYGCGDSFAAGFTFGLASGAPVDEAATIGARCGARALTRTGAP
jgi:ribokinase